jgi:DNA polymerase III epsilon subunit-like protein
MPILRQSTFTNKNLIAFSCSKRLRTYHLNFVSINTKTYQTKLKKIKKEKIYRKFIKSSIMEEVSNLCNIQLHAPEIVFFDLETNVPKKVGQGFYVLEFGAIVVSAHKLSEIESYTTLIRPKDLSVVSVKPSRSDGITREAVKNAPCFEDVAERIFSILNGRVWAGHNIQRFDCVRIKEAFDGINMPAPVPIGIIDSLGVLTEKFGRRAGNMKVIRVTRNI